MIVNIQINMPTKTISRPKKATTVHKKRVGKHQKRSQTFHKVYLPYLPLVVAIVASMLISGWGPHRATLAYATNMSASGLLASTNSERANNGQSALILNQQLINAAQAKAQDMIARNYWSHNTPDGQEPWVFVQAAGYQYQKAGENLAYGFLTSSDTVVGWMNSPTHKANMLDGSFTDVGFGFANGENFNNSGPETVVVAMYGRPQTLAQTDTQQTPPPVPQPAPAEQPSAPLPEPTTEPELAPEPTETQTAQQQAFTTDLPGLEPVSRTVTRVETLTNGEAPWSVFVVGIFLGAAVMLVLLKHGLALRRLIKSSEEFVHHHPLFDSVVLGIIVIAVTLLSGAGVIL